MNFRYISSSFDQTWDWELLLSISSIDSVRKGPSDGHTQICWSTRDFRIFFRILERRNLLKQRGYLIRKAGQEETMLPTLDRLLCGTSKSAATMAADGARPALRRPSKCLPKYSSLCSALMKQRPPRRRSVEHYKRTGTTRREFRYHLEQAWVDALNEVWVQQQEQHEVGFEEASTWPAWSTWASQTYSNWTNPIVDVNQTCADMEIRCRRCLHLLLRRANGDYDIDKRAESCSCLSLHFGSLTQDPLKSPLRGWVFDLVPLCSIFSDATLWFMLTLLWSSSTVSAVVSIDDVVQTNKQTASSERTFALKEQK